MSCTMHAWDKTLRSLKIALKIQALVIVLPQVLGGMAKLKKDPKKFLKRLLNLYLRGIA
jgi:hypothetical protein